jgi:hypothetical protein
MSAFPTSEKVHGGDHIWPVGLSVAVVARRINRESGSRESSPESRIFFGVSTPKREETTHEESRADVERKIDC